jgi:putative hydrolase of the HAD superfamily
LLASGKVQLDDALLQQLIDTDTLSWCENVDIRMLDWATNLRQNGLQTGIFSNMPADILEYLRTQQSWLADFNFGVFSCEYDVVKPDAAIYQHLVEAAGLAAPHLLFLDDREENIEAARTAGLQAELFTSYEALKDHWSWPIPAPS